MVEKVRDKPTIIRLLQDDIRGEHAAIMQYLEHSYRMGEGELPAEIEEIAREEMRHFRWLCEMVVELGGSPTLERDPIFLTAPSEVDLLRLDIDAEDRAIAQYRDHIARIDHPRVVRLLERILADELSHRQNFGGFVEELGGENAGTQAAGVGPWSEGPRDAMLALDAPAQSGPYSGDGADAGDAGANGADSEAARPADQAEPVAPNVRLIGQLNQDIRDEYATILRQLHLSFVTTDPKLKLALLEDHAQWHMKHMGWLSEQVAELGGTPVSDHNPVDTSGSTRQRLADELKHQGERTAHYRAERDDTGDEATHFLLNRIVTHDADMGERLVDLLAEAEEQPETPRAKPSPAGRLTVGSLLGQRQTN